MYCNYCKSENLFLKNDGDKTGLYCKSCGRWLSWVSPAEKAKIEGQLEKQKREIRIDGLDVQRVMDKFKKLKEKYKTLSDDIQYTKEHVAKSGSEIEKKAFYDKIVKLKDLSIRITDFDEVLTALHLK